MDEGDDGRTVDPRPAQDSVRAVRRVLEIVPGERRLLPDFGCRVHALASLRTARDRDLGAGLVEEALERWAPELGVERAEVAASREGWIRVTLHFGDRSSEVEIKHRRERATSRADSASHERSPEAREEPAA